MSEAAPVDEIVDLEFDLPEPPAKVWRALTEPDTVARWIAPNAHDAGDDQPARYDMLDAEIGSRVSYRWRDGENFDGVVTFSISANTIGGTRLRIVQSELPAVVAARTPLACRVALDTCRRPRLLAAANLNLAAFRRAA